jgi:hypothetical protein
MQQSRADGGVRSISPGVVTPNGTPACLGRVPAAGRGAGEQDAVGVERHTKNLRMGGCCQREGEAEHQQRDAGLQP